MIFSFLLASTVACAAADELLLPKYKNWMERFPANKAVAQTCASPRPKLNKLTRRYRTAIGYQFKEDGSKANFCSKYFAMATPITGGGDLYIFDCETGKPAVYSTKRQALLQPRVSPTSCALVINEPHETYTVADFATKNSKGEYPMPALGPPRLYVWDGHKVTPMKDEIWPGPSDSGEY